MIGAAVGCAAADVVVPLLLLCVVLPQPAGVTIAVAVAAPKTMRIIPPGWLPRGSLPQSDP
jgi:hypothetical protein